MTKALISVSFMLFVFLLKTTAQEKIFIILIKGEAQITVRGNDKPETVTRALKNILPDQSLLSMSKDARAIVFNSKAKLEIGGEKPMIYSTKDLALKLNKMKISSSTTKFIEYLDKMYSNMKSINESAGLSVGAASRGDGKLPFTYIPDDEAIILSDSVRLSWDNADSIVEGKLYVIYNAENDTVYSLVPLSKGSLVLRPERPG